MIAALLASSVATAAPGPYLDRAMLEAALPTSWPCAPAGDGVAVLTGVVAADGRLHLDPQPPTAPACLGPAVEALRFPAHPEAAVPVQFSFTWAAGRLLPPAVDRAPPPAPVLLFLHLPAGLPAGAAEALERALGLRRSEGV